MENPLIKITVLLAIACLMFPLVGCKGKSASKRGQDALKTSVIYRERIILPRKATVTVAFEDISKMDMAATVIASKTILPEGTPPYFVNITYAASKLNENGRYAVRAKIEENGKLLFVSDTHIDPFAGPAGEPVEILVKSVAR